MTVQLNIESRHRPVLDPEFVPASLWTRAYGRLAGSPTGRPFRICLERSDGTRSTHDTKILPTGHELAALDLIHVERLLKFLLWQKGGFRIYLGGDDNLARQVAAIYTPAGKRAWDNNFMGDKAYRQPMEFIIAAIDEVPGSRESESSLGGHLDGCRIGFDLGGSDRKCAAVIDGKVVHTEEIEWSPYFESDIEYHRTGINDSIRRAAGHLPRIDAIGGSAAGVYVDSEPRVGSLFRGIPDSEFDRSVRPLFRQIRGEWDNVPFVVVNDGEVTALAGSMSTEANSFLGIAMGTSQAVGYITPEGNITPWLNELAFAPIDYRADYPLDEWSGDAGCGAQYFSQQGIARLAPAAGIEFADDVPLPDRLKEVQRLMNDGDQRAKDIYDTTGTYFGYAVAHYGQFYELKNLLVLGRVTSGPGGEMIVSKAKEILRDEFPDLHEAIEFRTPNEQDKRHGQAVAAASLPELGK
jgi:predicted NBD/HSP70 family sugar kinase